MNQAVFDLLTSQTNYELGGALLDVPCGDGNFAQFFKTVFPKSRVLGVDKYCKPSKMDFEFYRLNAHEFFNSHQIENLDAITCISGVMCFDGIEELLASFHLRLKEGGLLVVTNDSVMTVRDRLNFLLFGHFKRFKLIFSEQEGNWNLLLPQSLLMHFQRQQFKQIQVQYTSVYTEDLFFFPVAVFIYLFLLISLFKAKSSSSWKMRMMLFPFKSLFARHYVVSAIK